MTAVVWLWSKRPTVRLLLACCLCRVKVTCSRSVRRHSAIRPPVLVALVGETKQSARVRTWKGSETLTIVCRVEVTATIVCVKWRCEHSQDRRLFALVLCWGALRYCMYWIIISTGLPRTTLLVIKKLSPFLFEHNFGKYCPIFKIIFSLLQTKINCA